MTVSCLSLLHFVLCELMKKTTLFELSWSVYATNHLQVLFIETVSIAVPLLALSATKLEPSSFHPFLRLTFNQSGHWPARTRTQQKCIVTDLRQCWPRVGYQRWHNMLQGRYSHLLVYPLLVKRACTQQGLVHQVNQQLLWPQNLFSMATAQLIRKLCMNPG